MDGEQLVVQLEARVDRFEKAFERASRTADTRWREVESHGRRSSVRIEQEWTRTVGVVTRGADVARNAVLRLGTAMGVALSVREVVQAADQWQQLSNKLAGAGVPTERLAGTLNKITAIALRTRTELTPTVDLFSKLTMVSEQYNLTADQAARITETVSKAMKAGGASAAEQASAILQLSQAIGSGVLQGDELRSLRENAPLLLKALAKELKTTTGALKEMGEQGKLTGDVILRALLGASREIDAAFSKTIPTLSDGFTNMKTSFIALIGEFDRGAGLTKKLGEALSGTGAKMDDLKAGAAGWGAYLAQQAEAALQKVRPLYDLLNALGRLSPIGLSLSFIEKSGTELERGKAMLRRGLGTPLSKDVGSLYDFGGGADGTDNIKAPPKDYGKKTDDLLRSTKDRTDALRVEAEVLGKSTFEAEKARTAQELLARAKAAEIPITEALRGKIDAVSAAYASETARLEKLKDAYQTISELKDATKSFATGLATDLANGVSKTEALANALARLRDRLLEMATSKIFDVVFSSTTGGVGSIFSSLVGHAGGGLVSGPGTGTSDSVPARLSDGEFVVNAAATSKYLDLLQAVNSGGSLKVPSVGSSIAVAAPTTVTQNFAPTIHVTAGTPQQNQDAAERMERHLIEVFETLYQRQTVREMRPGGLLNRL